MKFRKSTRYALFAATELARLAPEETITAAEVAARYDVPVSVMAKVFQVLVRGGISTGTRGQRGGYRLARPSSETTLLDVITLFEPPVTSDGTEARGGDTKSANRDRLRRVLEEVDELVRCTFASISLETVVGDGPASTWRVPPDPARGYGRA